MGRRSDGHRLQQELIEIVLSVLVPAQRWTTCSGSSAAKAAAKPAVRRREVSLRSASELGADADFDQQPFDRNQRGHIAREHEDQRARAAGGSQRKFKKCCATRPGP